MLDFPRKINFALQEGACNERCPKCFVHGTNNEGEKKRSGTMPREMISRLLKEAAPHRPLVTPSFFSEPLIAGNFEFFVREAAANGLPVNLCTNGVLLDEKMGEFLLEQGVALLSVSIDATSRETFRKVRGVDKFETVVANIRRFLERRPESGGPRVTVSFGIEDANRHELEAFKAQWTPLADCVKIYGVYSRRKALYDAPAQSRRLPCREVFDQMNVYFDGTALMCCLDGRAKTNLGDVFASGIAAVWNSPAYAALRASHVSGDYSTLDFCRDCSLWATFDIVREEVVDSVLIRSSEGIEYRNRLDRLAGWGEELRRVEIGELFDERK